MSSYDELNIAVAEALGWQWWYFPNGKVVFHRIVSPGSDWPEKRWGAVKCARPPEWREEIDGVPDYAGDLSTAIRLLDGHGWVMHTCDNGYLCQIHEAPEKGEAVLGNGVGATPAEAICRAFLEMKKGKQ